MKKLLLFAMLMMAMTVTAQDLGALKPVRYNADPMTNEVGYTVWENKYIRFTEDDKGEVNIILQNPPHIFDTCAEYPRIGFYDMNGNLIAMSKQVTDWKSQSKTNLYIINVWAADSILPYCEHVPNQRFRHYCTSPKGILKFLKNHEGYIRIIACLYGDMLMDIKEISFSK